MLPRLLARYRQMIAELERMLMETDVDRARTMLKDIVGPEIKLVKDPTGRFLKAQVGISVEYSTELVAGDGHMVGVPRAGVEPATYRLGGGRSIH